MGIEQNIKLNKMVEDGQFKIQFKDEDKEDRINAAREFGILESDKLIKKDGIWYFDGMTASQYNHLMSGNDVDDIYGKRN